MMRLLILCTCLCAILTATGCFETREEREALKRGAGTLGTFFGIPRNVTEGLVEAALLATVGTACHKNGRRTERKSRTALAPKG